MPADYSSLLAELDRGTLVVTGSVALARAIRDARLRACDGKVCETPAVLAWSAWLRSGWQQLLDGVLEGRRPYPGDLMTGLQAQAVWEDLISATVDDFPLLQTGATARALEHAWGQVHAWRIPLDHPLWNDSREGQAFRDWAQAYRRRCRRDRLLDTAVLADRLAASFDAGELDPPARLLLAGFAPITPQQRALADSLQRRGTVLDYWQVPSRPPGPITRLCFPDQQAEFQALAGWASRATGRVAILVPRLSECRDALLDALEAELEPDGARTPGWAPLSTWRVASGEPLADQARSGPPCACSDWGTVSRRRRISVSCCGHRSYWGARGRRLPAPRWISICAAGATRD